MNFSIQAEDLLSEFKVINQIVPKHTTFPILSNIRIKVESDKIHIFGTDLDTSLSYNSNLVDVKEEGTIIVPAGTLYSMLREIKGEVNFVQEGNRVKVEYEKGYFYLPSMDIEDFPSEPVISKDKTYQVELDKIEKTIDKLVFIVPEDSAKRNMSGMLWEYDDGTLKMVATDSFSLGYRDIEVDMGEESFDVVIPPKILKQISSFESKEINVGVDESRIYFIGDKYTMVSNLIKVDFPNYNSAIPENNENVLVVEGNSFLSSLKRVSVFADDKPKTVILSLGNELSVEATSEIGEGREELNGEYTGSSLNIALSSNYLSDFLRRIESTNVNLSFGGSERPVIIEGEDKDIFYLLMPVTID